MIVKLVSIHQSNLRLVLHLFYKLYSIISEMIADILQRSKLHLRYLIINNSSLTWLAHWCPASDLEELVQSVSRIE